MVCQTVQGENLRTLPGIEQQIVRQVEQGSTTTQRAHLLGECGRCLLSSAGHVSQGQNPAGDPISEHLVRLREHRRFYFVGGDRNRRTWQPSPDYVQGWTSVSGVRLDSHTKRSQGGLRSRAAE